MSLEKDFNRFFLLNKLSHLLMDFLIQQYVLTQVENNETLVELDSTKKKEVLLEETTSKMFLSAINNNKSLLILPSMYFRMFTLFNTPFGILTFSNISIFSKRYHASWDSILSRVRPSFPLLSTSSFQNQDQSFANLGENDVEEEDLRTDVSKYCQILQYELLQFYALRKISYLLHWCLLGEGLTVMNILKFWDARLAAFSLNSLVYLRCQYQRGFFARSYYYKVRKCLVGWTRRH